MNKRTQVPGATETPATGFLPLGVSIASKQNLAVYISLAYWMINAIIVQRELGIFRKPLIFLLGMMLVHLFQGHCAAEGGQACSQELY